MYQISIEDLKGLVSFGLRSDEPPDIEKFDSTVKVSSLLQTSLQKGLNENNIEKSRNHFGSNMTPIQSPMSKLKAFQITITQPPFLFFISFSFLTLLLRCHNTKWEYSNLWIENIILVILVSLNFVSSMIKIYQNDINAKNFKLQKDYRPIKVIRNGKQVFITQGNLVVGDIVYLCQGEKAVVDGLVIEAHNLYLDEQSITGSDERKVKSSIESKNSQKVNLSNHIVFGGTKVIQGKGKIIILTVGKNVMANSKKQEVIEQTQFQAQVSETQKKIQKYGSFLALFLTIILIGWHLIIKKEISLITISYAANLFLILLYGFYSNLLVAYYIETRKCVLDQFETNFLHVRNQKSVELLSSMNKIIFDKTAILSHYFQISKIWNDKIQQLTPLLVDSFPEDFKRALVQCCYMKNNMKYFWCIWGEDLEKHHLELVIYMFFKRWGEAYKDYITSPYSLTPRISIINQKRILVRGDLSTILQSSKYYFSHTKGIIQLDNTLIEKIKQQEIELIKDEKVQALAYCDITNLDFKGDFLKLENLDLTFLALISFSTPLDKYFVSTVNELKQAGIMIAMVTADCYSTQSIAQKAQIYDENSEIVDGQQFARQISHKYQQSLLDIEKISILCNASPQIKKDFVEQSQKQGFVVGYCGNKTDDSFALDKADIGFSVESSDIIIYDSIQPITASIILSRNFMDTIKRFTQYELSFFISLTLVLIIASAAIGNSQIQPIQLFWIYVVNDLLIYALQNTNPKRSILFRKPSQKDEKLLYTIIIVQIGILSFYQVTASLLFINNPIMLFNVFVIILVFNLISSRMIKKIQKLIMPVTILIIFACQFLIIQYGRDFTQTNDGLSYNQWIICFAVGFGSVLWRILASLIMRPIFRQNHVELIDE